MKRSPYDNDTIAAIATPPGEGGIAVIRISGPGALDVAGAVFRGALPVERMQSGRVYYGRMLRPGGGADQNGVIDEGLLTCFRAPASYTGEDVAELSGHGGVYVSRQVLEAVIQAGARLAAPGEFTQRAFLNGKMDLAQAQGVADLIHARSESARRVAMTQLEGGLSQKVNEFRDTLIDVCGRLEIELDFADEDVEAISSDELDSQLRKLILEIDELIKTYDRGRVCREGVNLVILGKPNVGKSSLMNALLARERAIVTATPGTTRDTIEDQMDLDGLLCNLVDTAGIRQSEDPIEMEGVRRSAAAARRAGVVLMVQDGSEAPDREDLEVEGLARSLGVPVLRVLNKCDLTLDRHWEGRGPETDCLFLSAQTGEGIEGLIFRIRKEALGDGLPGVEDVVLAHLSHVDALRRCLDHIQQTLDSQAAGMTQEFLAMDLRGALADLGEIVGAVTAEDILNHVFASFCIGK